MTKYKRSLITHLWIALMAVASPLSALPVQLTVVEAGTGQPVACRIHLKDHTGKPVRPPGLPFWYDHFVCTGSTELELSSGRYSYEIERGLEYGSRAGNIEVGGPGPVRVRERLERLVDLAQEGWWSGELHVHRPPAQIELLMQAEDLHVAPVITWWNTQNLWRDRPLPANPLVRFDTNRFYRVLGGEDERGGGALLYFNLAQPLDFTGAKREYPSPMKYLEEARRQPGAWVDLEKPFWYDTPLWLASGVIDSIGLAHNHMQRGGVMANEAWGRARDRQRFPDPYGNGLWTQEIYYQVLNSGLRLPPSAGSASGVLANPVGYNRVYVHLDALTYEDWWAGLKAGRVFVSNGPLLRCQADGHYPGHVFRAPVGQTLEFKLDVKLDSRDPIARVEVVQDGRVISSVSGTEFKQTGRLGSVRFARSGWFLVRALADVPNTFRFASTGPFYVEIGPETRRVSKHSAQFFLDWVRERMGRLQLPDAQEQEAVLKFQREAEHYWEQKVAQANAE